MEFTALPLICRLRKSLWYDFIRRFFKGKESAPFTIKRGVRQGFVLSPLLFLIVLDSVMVQTNIERPNGIQWHPHQRLNDLDYADDVCLMSHTFAGIEEKLRRL